MFLDVANNKTVVLSSLSVVDYSVESNSVVDGGEVEETNPGDSILYGWLRKSETFNSLHSQLNYLTATQNTDLSNIIKEYNALFPDIPSS